MKRIDYYTKMAQYFPAKFTIVDPKTSLHKPSNSVILVKKGDGFYGKKRPVILPRPYPISEWISYFGFTSSQHYTAAVSEPIEHFIKRF